MEVSAVSYTCLPPHTHTHAHARTRARAHTHTHTEGTNLHYW